MGRSRSPPGIDEPQRIPGRDGVEVWETSDPSSVPRSRFARVGEARTGGEGRFVRRALVLLLALLFAIGGSSAAWAAAGDIDTSFAEQEFIEVGL